MNGQDNTQNINLGNWNYCHYFTGPLKAMISCGQGLDVLDNDDLGLEYYVSVLKDEFSEVFQKDFKNLGEAIQFINDSYGHWDFKDSTIQESGCDSCSNS